MKLAPVPMAFPKDAERYAVQSARTTHGAPEAIDATQYFARLLVKALTRRRATCSDAARVKLHKKVDPVAGGSYLKKQPPEIQGNGYIVLALEAALWAVASTSSFEDAILAAANLGDDADTTAAIAGQLAGALYGVDGSRHLAGEAASITTRSSTSPTACTTSRSARSDPHRAHRRARRRRPCTPPTRCSRTSSPAS